MSYDLQDIFFKGKVHIKLLCNLIDEDIRFKLKQKIQHCDCFLFIVARNNQQPICQGR